MILSRLREQTRPHHEALEARLGLLERAITPDGYRDLLRRFWGAYEPLEARLGAVADWESLGFDFERRRKVPLLERDLAAVGIQRELLEGLRCTHRAELVTVAQALGCMYVLEGATLGGQIITRHLKNQLGGPYPTAFFASYGDNVGPMWKAFGTFLTGYEENRGGGDAIVASACATFDTLGAWLTEGEARS